LTTSNVIRWWQVSLLTEQYIKLSWNWCVSRKFFTTKQKKKLEFEIIQICWNQVVLIVGVCGGIFRKWSEGNWVPHWLLLSGLQAAFVVSAGHPWTMVHVTPLFPRWLHFGDSSCEERCIDLSGWIPLWAGARPRRA
jgi:hypothetical protein